MAKYKIQVSEDKNSLAKAASDLLAQIIESTLKNKTRAKIYDSVFHYKLVSKSKTIKFGKDDNIFDKNYINEY